MLLALPEEIGTLEELAMPQNGINPPGISALVLPQLQALEVINFGDCLLKTEGALALAKALKLGQKKLKHPDEEEEGDLVEDPALQITGTAITPSKQGSTNPELCDELSKLSLS
nr:hypothetical protein BaRGS_008730 [Batillaria attramentaria]